MEQRIELHTHLMSAEERANLSQLAVRVGSATSPIASVESTVVIVHRIVEEAEARLRNLPLQVCASN